MKYIITFFGVFFLAITLQGQVKSWRTDPVYRLIVHYQDTRNSAELVKYLKHKNVKYRKWAVMAFASVQDTSVAPTLLELLGERKYRVKKEAAYSLGQLRKAWLSKDLVKAYKEERKMAVKVVLLESIGKCADKNTTVFFEGLKLPSGKSVLQQAYARGAFHAARRGCKSDIILHRLHALSMESSDTFIRYVYCNLSKKRVAPAKTITAKPDIKLYDALDTINRIENPYEKVKYLEGFHLSQEDLLTIAFSSEHPFLKSYCMEQYFKEKARNFNVIEQCLFSRNIAFIGMAAEKVRTDSLWRDMAEEKIHLLANVQQDLRMPRDFEAYVEIARTICYLQGKPYTYVPPQYNHEIDWTYLEQLKDVEQVRIRTNKGSMLLTCFVKDVPASAANFLKLVDAGYYNEKYIHRMVPDFVVQGGCPRGDGWGALDWTQRSEFHQDLTYVKGSVGLASAGKDSEGVQFFITHGFTPSLDGRYTIFGEITEGLEVIDQLIIGDMILSMERVK